MKINNLKTAIKLNIQNVGGWRINRKIVVFESDDWGSIRMPSYNVYEKCCAAGYAVDKIKIEKFDSLESEKDLMNLFEILYKFKDYYGNHPIFTANCLVTNPDFEKIKQSGFTNYYYELVTDTFNKYPHHSHSFSLWHQGLKEKIFYPQSHGREHLNVSLFMHDMQTGNPDTLFGFHHCMPGSLSLKNFKKGNIYVESLNYRTQDDKKEKLKIIIEGLDLFEKLMGYRSVSFIPPNYIWTHDYDEALAQKGVKYFQGKARMREPDLSGGFDYYKIRIGNTNEFGQYYLVRNCGFEPSNASINDVVGHCMTSIDAAFRWDKPAIVNTHRYNYIGSIFPENADRSLLKLKELIERIIKRWPDVEFLTSVELGELISSCKN